MLPSSRRPPALLAPPALPLVMLFAGLLLAVAPAAMGETSPAKDRLLRLVESGAFGAAGPIHERPATIVLTVRGESLEGPAPLVLADPGERVEIRAELHPSGAPLPQPELDPVRDIGSFRQSYITEFSWSGEPNDRLFQGRGDSVHWRAGDSGGRASYLAVEGARLRIDRSAAALANPSMNTPAALYSGRASLLLLSGVAYDRAGDGIVHGYNVGIYPNEQGSSAPAAVQDRSDLYRPPTTLYRLDSRSADARVTRTFTLGQLAPPIFPTDTPEYRYIALSPRLLTFLRALEDRLERDGIDPARLAILRGFVSPTARLRLAQRGESLASFSRFQYGDAVALVLREQPGPPGQSPPRMADLNDDDEVDREDARILADIVKDTMDELGMYGGLGVYSAFQGEGAGNGSPYVHVDTRGYYVTFGD